LRVTAACPACEEGCQAAADQKQQFYFYNFVTSPTRQQVKICLKKTEKPLRGFFPCGF
jgi:hypothetical protein